MAKKLFVGSLPYKTTSDELSEMFAQAGKVESATVISDKFSGRSRGFGFVEMSTDEEAAKAMEMLDGQEIDGRKIVVREAQDKPSRPRSGGFRSNDRDRY